MKKILIPVFAAIAFTACSDSEPQETSTIDAQSQAEQVALAQKKAQMNEAALKTMGFKENVRQSCSAQKNPADRIRYTLNIKSGNLTRTFVPQGQKDGESTVISNQTPKSLAEMMHRECYVRKEKKGNSGELRPIKFNFPGY